MRRLALASAAALLLPLAACGSPAAEREEGTAESANADREGDEEQEQTAEEGGEDEGGEQ